MSTPARRAIAIRWMMALVEQPIAIATAIALWNAARVRIVDGGRSSQTISTMRRPQWVAMRVWSRPPRGSTDAPGSAMPSASAIAVIVLAVPIVMQVPWLRAMPATIAIHSARVDLAGAALVPVLAGVGAGAERLAVPVAAQHRPGRQEDAGRPVLVAPISSAGVVLSQPPISTTPSTGWQRSISSTSIASMLR